MTLSLHTHRIAVNAFLIHEDRFLLLKRAQKPFIWGPPGGKLQIDYDLGFKLSDFKLAWRTFLMNSNL